MKKILFVCTANYCRSPAAQALAEDWLKKRNLQEEFLIASAGTHGYFAGKTPDPRILDQLAKKSISMTSIFSQQIALSDFDFYDYIIAMSEENYQNLMSLAPKKSKDKISLLLSYLNKEADNLSVPDPYSDEAGFREVVDLIEQAVDALMTSVLETQP